MKTYLAKYNPKLNGGVYAISLVENPAMEGLFVALSKQEEVKLAEVDKEQRVLMGLVLEPNKPIYRNQGGEEFNIVFDEETIKELSHGFFKSGHQGNSTIEHEPKQKIEGVTFVESWIVENPKVDKSTNFGFSYPKGSWIATMKVDSDEVWNDYVKTGKVQGFSVDALISLEEVNLKSNNSDLDFRNKMVAHHKMAIDMVNEYEGLLKDKTLLKIASDIIETQTVEINTMQKLNLKSELNMSKEVEKTFLDVLKDLPNQIALALSPKKEEVQITFGSVKLADGSLTLEFEGDVMTAGGSVWIMAEDGTKVPAPVGEHALENGNVLIVTEEGVIAELKPMETEEPEQEMAEQPTVTESASNDAKIAEEISTAIKSILIKYSEQEQVITELKEQVLELSKEPISAGIKQPQVAVDLSKMTKQERILFNLRNS